MAYLGDYYNGRGAESVFVHLDCNRILNYLLFSTVNISSASWKVAAGICLPGSNSIIHSLNLRQINSWIEVNLRDLLIQHQGKKANYQADVIVISTALLTGRSSLTYKNY